MNRNFIFASLLLAIAVNIAIIGCHRKGENESTSNPDSARIPAVAMADTIIPYMDSLKGKYENALIEIKTYSNDPVLGGFGYDVYLDHKLYVHQPHVPAVSGSKGFSSAANAKRTGEYIGYKIKHNIMPPSVSPHELDSLGVLK
ncbi:hypothetical protein BH11BAC1_BH11BAC1_21810 [soil metagenome]